MRTLRRRTFPGGVRLPENKGTEHCWIRELAPPRRAEVFLSQHAGAPAKPVAAKGDEVATGQLIGESTAFISAPVHSPVTGRVAGLEKKLNAAGALVETVIIDTAETERWSLMPALDWRGADADRLLDRVREAGLVGLGGAAFPTAVKLSPPKPVDTLVVNGCECEPYLTADHRIMLERPDEVVEGALVLARILKVGSLCFGIEDNKPDAAALIEARLGFLSPPGQGPKAGVAVLASKYPQGGEKSLIYALLGRQVPSRGLPMDVGVVVVNVGTALAAREAVCAGLPLVRRVVTVTGRVANPANLLVRIGTPLSELVDACGGFTVEEAAVVMGGPMMGAPLPSLDYPVVKGTSGLTVLGPEELRSSDYGPCLRCGRCVDACPQRLQPWLYGLYSDRGMFEPCAGLSVADCMECGCCTYICPARRPNVQWIKLAKAMIAQAGKKQ